MAHSSVPARPTRSVRDAPEADVADVADVARDAHRGRTAVVAGGGPGGVAAALLLARLGLSVTVLERVADPAAVGGALLLQPHGLAVLDGLGLGLVPGARRLRASRIHDGRGRALLDAPVVAGGSGLDANLVVRRSALFAALHGAADRDPRVDVRLGHAARALDERGVVARSAAGAEVVVPADVVVVADGARSTLRATVAPAAEVRPGPVYVRAIVAGTLGADGGDDVSGEWWTTLGLFGAAPLDDGTTYLFASASHPDLAAALDAGDVARFARRWAVALPLAGEALGRVGGIRELLVTRTDEVRAPGWVAGRAVLLGDAAHAMLPNTGQGANSALVDAAVLALELARSAEISPALAAYDRRRRPAVRVAQDDARRLARLAHLSSGPARLGRDLLVRVAGCLPAGRQARRLYQEDPAALRAALLSLPT